MPLFERSANDILGSMILDLTSNSRITRVSPGAKARAILQTVSTNLNVAYKTFDINLARAFLSGASGQYLDLIGELVNTVRLGSATASVSSTAKVVKFYVATGTFGSINGGSNIVVPAGTILFTNEDGSGISYKLLTGVTLLSSGTEQFVSVEALAPGEVSNIGIQTLQFHNFTNYLDSTNKTLLVNNISSIFSGANIESDINYKFRISRAVTAAEAANQTAILLASLSVPGVANVVLQNRAAGIGTFKVLIKSVTPSVSPGLIDDVQAALFLVAAEGTYPIADKPRETGMSFVLTLYYNNGVSDTDKDSIETQVKAAIADYVNNLDIGQEFILNQLVEQVLSVSPSIKDMGSPQHPVDQAFIYKESRLRDTKIRNELFANYIPASDERIIIEPSLAEAVTIFRGA